MEWLRKPVLSGVFVPLRRNGPLPGESRVTRLIIMNLVPANSLQKLMADDLGTVAGSAHWASIQLRKGEAALVGRRPSGSVLRLVATCCLAMADD